MTAFLCICHFLIVTILITVLTNSFMAIVQNANEEHQFVFAVNTISMVKSDALFSYVAPTNIIAWFLTPLRFLLPFRQYVRMNRTVIKVTHFPVLFIIFAYERLILQSSSFDPTDLIEQRGRSTTKSKVLDPANRGLGLFSPSQRRLREPSVATFHKDKALDAVFRPPFRGNTIRVGKGPDRRKTSNVVNNWMQGMGPTGTASPPQEQDSTLFDKLETRRARRRPQATNRRSTTQSQNFTEATFSIASEPEDLGFSDFPQRPRFYRRRTSAVPNLSPINLPEETDVDRYGDDELLTHDDDEKSATENREPWTEFNRRDQFSEPDGDYFQRTPTNKIKIPSLPSSYRVATPKPSEAAAARADVYKPVRRTHARNFSTNTVLYDPPAQVLDSSSSPSRKEVTAQNSSRNTGTGSGTRTPVTPGHRTPKRQIPARVRPIMPARNIMKSAPDLAGLLSFNNDPSTRRNFSMDIGSDIGDNKAIGGGFVGAVPASLATQMEFAKYRDSRKTAETDDQNRMSKLMLARMNNLEEGFRDILQEVKDWRKDEIRSAGDEVSPPTRLGKRRSKKAQKKGQARFTIEATRSRQGSNEEESRTGGLAGRAEFDQAQEADDQGRGPASSI